MRQSNVVALLLIALVALVTLIVALVPYPRETSCDAIKFQAWIIGSEENTEEAINRLSKEVAYAVTQLSGEWSPEAEEIEDFYFRWSTWWSTGSKDSEPTFIFFEPREKYEEDHASDWSYFVDIEIRYRKSTSLQEIAKDLSSEIPTVFVLGLITKQAQERDQRDYGTPFYTVKWSAEKRVEESAKASITSIRLQSWFFWRGQGEVSFDNFQHGMNRIVVTWLAKSLREKARLPESIREKAGDASIERLPDRTICWTRWLVTAEGQEAAKFKSSREELEKNHPLPNWSHRAEIVVINDTKVSPEEMVDALTFEIPQIFWLYKQGVEQGEYRGDHYKVIWSLEGGNER